MSVSMGGTVVQFRRPRRERTPESLLSKEALQEPPGQPTPSLLGRDQDSANRGNRSCLLAGGSPDPLVDQSCPRCVGRRRETSLCVPHTKYVSGMCPCVLGTDNNKLPICRALVSPLTDSNRRPPPYHGGSEAVTAYTTGHPRPRLSCKSALPDVSMCPHVTARVLPDVPVSYPRTVACSQNIRRRGWMRLITT